VVSLAWTSAFAHFENSNADCCVMVSLQGMGYVCSFLMLSSPPDDVAKMLHALGTSDKYMKGFWMARPSAFARDAMVFERLLSERDPEVARKLRSAGVVPEAYTQKYFCGLCVHVLPFKHLFTFYDRFMERGWTYLQRFALGLASKLRQRILEAPEGDSSNLLSLLRLDAKVNHFPPKILHPKPSTRRKGESLSTQTSKP
jgi:hypothetical protein